MTALYVMSAELRWFVDLVRFRFQTTMLLRRYRIRRWVDPRPFRAK